MNDRFLWAGGLGRRGLIATLVAAPLAPARAQGFPARPVRVVVPFGAGGSVDTLMRLLGPGFERSIGQPAVIENRGGAGGTIGTAFVARAAPDGYTVLAIPNAHTINPAVFPSLPYDSVHDFAPITLLASSTYVLVVHPDVPARTVAELIDLARKSPNGLSYASPGYGTANHLGMELLKSVAGIDLVHVPYDSAGPAVTALLAGQIPTMMGPAITVMPLIQSGRLRALAMTNPRPMASLPGVPPIADTLPGFDATAWYGVVAPAGTPADVVAKLRTAFLAGLEAPGVREKLLDQGVEPTPSTSEEFARLIATETEKWARVARSASAKVD